MTELLDLPTKLEKLLEKLKKFDSDHVIGNKGANDSSATQAQIKRLNYFSAQITKIENFIKVYRALTLSKGIKIPLLWEALYSKISPLVENIRCAVDVDGSQYEYNPVAFLVFAIINAHFDFLENPKYKELHIERLKIKARTIFKVEKERHLEKYFSKDQEALKRFHVSERLSRLYHPKVEANLLICE